MHLRFRTHVALWALVAVSLQIAYAEEAKPFLHPLFTSNMVLQRDTKDPIWGWTTPGQEVTVSMEGKTAKVAAGADGKWMAKIGPFRAGGPYTLTVTGPETVTLDNVLTGDVWLCSGQSNMEMGIGLARDAAVEIQNADHPRIRLYTVQKSTAYLPKETTDGPWKVCAPDTVGVGGWGGFSAAAYYFGRELNAKLNVPIGLVHSSWGGTIAEAWTSADSLQKMSDFKEQLASARQIADEQLKGTQNESKVWTQWWQKNDPGATGNWQEPNFNDVGWKELPVQGTWENGPLPNFDGVVWFRKAIDLPADWNGKAAVLHLGAIDDRDTTWVNGTFVGALSGWTTPRNYSLPAGLLKPGHNEIVVRVLDTGGGGGFQTGPAPMKLEVPGTALSIPLGEKWKFQEGKPLNQLSPPPPDNNNSPNVVTVLYNGMIAPLEPFAIKGAIWYQGESNAGRGEQYKTLLPTLISDWRERFENPNLPFYIVQLANYMKADDQPPGDSSWARLRDAQAYTAQTVANTGLAVAIDIGDANDIHPKNKQEIGRRLALNALALAYGQKVEYSGPIYQSMKVEDGKVRVKFTHARGLKAKDGKLSGFAIAGADNKWVWADAVIDGDSVLVSSPNVTEPANVRYAWGNNPSANLYNAAGLPAVPFRTDKD